MQKKINNSWDKISNSNPLAFFIIIFCFVLRFHNEIFNYQLIGGGFDQAVIFSPLFIKISSLFGNGENVFWLPELQGGIPFYHSPLMSAHYPFYGFSILEYTEWVDTFRKITLLSIFHILIYAFSVWYLLRSFEIKSLYAGVVASASIGSGMLYFHAKWIIALAGFTWIPMFFAGIVYFFKNPSSYKGSVIITFAFSMIVLAKPSHPTIYTFYLGSFLFAALLLHNIKDYKQLIPKMILIALLVLGITAVVFIPILEHTGLYIRPGSKGTEVGNNLIPVSSYSKGLSLETIKHFLIFSLKNMGMGNLYIGAAVLALAPFGIIKSIQTKTHKVRYLIIAFGVLGLYSLVSSFGVDSYLFELNRKLPLMNQLRHPLRFMFFSNITLFILAGLGLDYISKSKTNLSSLSFVILLFILTSLQFSFGSGYTLISIICMVLFLFLLKYRPSLKQIILPLAVILSLSISFTSLAKKRITSTKSSLFYKKENIEANEVLMKVKKLSTGSPLNYRFNVIDDKVPANWWSAFGLNYGLRSFSSIVPPYLKHHRSEVQHQKNLDYKSLWGSKFTIYNKSLEATAITNQNIVFESENYKVIENEHYAPRFYLVDRLIKTRNNLNSLIKKIENKKSLIGKVAFTSNDSLINIINQITKDDESEDGGLEIVSQSNNKTLLQCSLKHQKVLVINELYSKEWQTLVDGESHNLFKINHNQMGVLLDKGEHSIELNYRYRKYGILKWISRISMFLCLLIAISLVIKYRKLKD